MEFSLQKRSSFVRRTVNIDSGVKKDSVTTIAEASNFRQKAVLDIEKNTTKYSFSNFKCPFKYSHLHIQELFPDVSVSQKLKAKLLDEQGHFVKCCISVAVFKSFATTEIKCYITK